MKSYRILYKWQGRHYQTTMQHYFASAAFVAAELMIMNGATAYAVEPIN